MSRRHFKTDAVVLNTHDYAESDRIVRIFTRAGGKMGAMAKGARRSRKRFVGNLEPPSLTAFTMSYKTGSELAILEDGVLIDGFQNLKKDIRRLTAGSYLLELTSEMTREGQRIPALFDLLTEVLKLLDESGGKNGVNESALLRYFEVSLLKTLGLMPHIDKCVECGGELSRPSFSTARGGALCRSCSPSIAGVVPVSMGALKLMGMAARLTPSRAARLTADAGVMDEAERVLGDFITAQTGKELKTTSFMKKLAAAGG